MTHRFVHRYMNWSPVSEIGSYDESHEHLPDSELVFACFPCQDEQGNWFQHCKFHRGLVLKHRKTFFFIFKVHVEICFFSCLHFEFIFISAFFGLWLEFVIPSGKNETFLGLAGLPWGFWGCLWLWQVGVLAWHGQNFQIAGESVPKPKKLNFLIFDNCFICGKGKPGQDLLRLIAQLNLI